MAGFEDDVVAVLRGLRAGEVVTYGEVATEAGYPGGGRAVGNVLARGDGLPWWRVVTSTGRLVPGHEHEHAQRLRAEGVSVEGGRVRFRPRDRLHDGRPFRGGRPRGNAEVGASSPHHAPRSERS